MAIEELYPRLRNNILAAREEGYSDEEIRARIGKKISAAIKEGYTAGEVNEHLSRVRLEDKYPEYAPGILAARKEGYSEEEINTRVSEKLRTISPEAMTEAQTEGLGATVTPELVKTVEDVIRPIPAGAMAQLVKGVGGIKQAYGEGAIKTAGKPQTTADIIHKTLNPEKWEAIQAARIKKAETTFMPVIEKGKEWVSGAEMVERAISEEHPLTQGSVSEAFRSAGTNMYAQAPLYLVGAGGSAARAMSLLAFGAPAFGATYTDQRKGGMSQETAMGAGLISMASEIGTEATPFTAFFEKGVPFAKKAIKIYLSEIMGESLNTTVDSAIDKMTINPNMTFTQFSRELDKIIKATLVQSTMTAGLARAIGGTPPRTPAQAPAATTTITPTLPAIERKGEEAPIAEGKAAPAAPETKETWQMTPEEYVEKQKSELGGHYLSEFEEAIRAEHKDLKDRTLSDFRKVENEVKETIAARPAEEGYTLPPRITAFESLKDKTRQVGFKTLPIEEQRALLHTSPVTGVGNTAKLQRDLKIKGGVLLEVEVANLKPTNDELGYEAGNALINSVPDIALEQGINADSVYHVGGGQGADKFRFRFENIEQAKSFGEQLTKAYEGATLRLPNKEGKVELWKGGLISYGTGQNIAEAEQSREADKQERIGRGIWPAVRGERHRGFRKSGELQEGRRLANSAPRESYKGNRPEVIALDDLSVYNNLAPVRELRTRAEAEGVESLTADEREKLAYIDEKTNIKNNLAYEIEKGRKPYQSIIDIDSIKKVNTDYGHEVGDHMLLEFAALVRQYGKVNDVYRIGGDEFAYQSKSPAETEFVLKKVAREFKQSEYRKKVKPSDMFQPVLRGGGFSYGTAKNQQEANIKIDAHKKHRTELKERIKGDFAPKTFKEKHLPALSPSQRRTLETVRAEVEQGEAGYRIHRDFGDMSYEMAKDIEPVIGVPSTFPDYFKNKEYTKAETLRAIDKALAGESLGQRQRHIVRDLNESYRQNLAEEHREGREKKRKYRDTIPFKREDATTLAERQPITTDYPIYAKGDVVAGDTIIFKEAIFAGSFRNSKYLGDRTIEAEVVRDSYGKDKQQHTFTLRILKSEGIQPIEAGTVTTRKGRNIYKNGTDRQKWADESARLISLEEKHERGAIARTERDIRKGILFKLAYHGSPHKFNKFTLEHIGAGEGAQTYGWGLYFAENEDVARYYKETLEYVVQSGYEWKGQKFTRGTPVFHALSLIWNKGIVEARKTAKSWIGTEGQSGKTPGYFDIVYAITQDVVRKADIKTIEAKGEEGRIYKVDLKPEKDEYLDWEKSLSEQSEKVRKILKENDLFGNRIAVSGMAISPDTFKGMSVYSHLSEKLGNDKAASLYLKSIGIPGIKYLDGASRTKGEGHHNFVIFDEELVEIEAIFKRGGDFASGLAPERITSALQGISKKWQNAPDYEIIDSEASLPKHIITAARGGEGAIEGVFDPRSGKVYLVANNIRDEKHATSIYLHETIGHYGLRGSLGDKITPTLQKVYARHKTEADRIAARYGIDTTTARGRALAGEEVLARLAQENPKSSLVHEAMFYVRKWLRSLGLNLRFSDSDVRHILTGAKKFVESGEQTEASGEESMFAREEKIGAIAEPSKLRKAVNMFAEFWSPLSTIPESRQYLENRYKAYGDIDRAERFITSIWEKTKKLSEADRKAIFHFLDGQTSQSELPQGVRLLAGSIRNAQNRIGQMLVKRGMLDEKTYAEHKGQYVRYLYLKHVLGDKMPIGGGSKAGLSYLKARKDLTPEQRKAIGLIEDVSIAVPVGMAQSLTDMAKYDFFNKIASNPQWVWEPSIVELPDATGKQLFRKIGIGKLVDETKAAREMARISPNSPQIKYHLAKLERALSKAEKATGNIPEDYQQIPNTPAYGALAGTFVRKPIALDILPLTEISKFQEAAKSLNIISDVTQKAMATFKVSKVALNPPTIIRNIVSNQFQLNLSGIPLYSLPGLEMKAVTAMKRHTPFYNEALRHGIFKTNWSAAEIGEILDTVTMIQKSGSKFYQIFLFAKKTAGLYGKIDDFFKLVKFIEQRERGASPGEAAVEAHKWVMDYSRAAPTIKAARKFWVPFASYQYKILPLLAEASTRPIGDFYGAGQHLSKGEGTQAAKDIGRGVKNTWLIAKYPIAIAMLTQAAMSAISADDDEFEKLKKSLPLYIKNNESLMLVPWRSPEGEIQWVNLEYYFPWQSALKAQRDLRSKENTSLQVIGDMIGNPLMNLYDVGKAVAGGDVPKDPYTHRPIYNELDKPTHKAIKLTEWLYNQWAPPLFTKSGLIGPDVSGNIIGGYGPKAVTGEKDRYGRTITPGVAAARVIGFNIIAPTKEQTARERFAQMKELQASLAGMMKNPTLTEEKKTEAIKEYKRRVSELKGE